jgi:hypothetical protein
MNQSFNLPNLCSHDPPGRFGLARVEPVFEISIAVALRAARASSPTVHSAPAASPYKPPAGRDGQRGSLPRIGWLWPN